MVREIPLLVELCQKDHPDQGFKNAGCAVTAAIMAAALSDRRIYTIRSFDGYVNGQKIWTSNNGSFNYGWRTPNGWSFASDASIGNKATEASQVALIKQYIDHSICPICYCSGNQGHWMLAFGYEVGDTYDDIWICDPADGERKSLADGMELSCLGTAAGITQIRAVNTI